MVSKKDKRHEPETEEEEEEEEEETEERGKQVAHARPVVAETVGSLLGKPVTLGVSLALAAAVGAIHLVSAAIEADTKKDLAVLTEHVKSIESLSQKSGTDIGDLNQKLAASEQARAKDTAAMTAQLYVINELVKKSPFDR